MNKNIINTKKKLTIIFTIVISIVIIVLGISFFSFKYYKELNFEKNMLNGIGNTIESGRISIENFIKLSHTSGNNILRKDIEKRFTKKHDSRPGKPNIVGSLSYIKFNKENIISYNIKDDIADNFVIDLLNTNIYNKSFELNGFIIRKVNSGDDEIILFKTIRYNISDYLSDSLIFIIVTLFFSGLLYLIGNKFVNKAFIPVELNIKDMNNFIHNAGHELKTPISVIDSNIQFIKDIKKYDESLMDEMKNETKKLNGLIESLIKLSDISDSHAINEAIDISHIINEILNDCKSQISDKNIAVKLKISEGNIIHANRDYLYILFSNIIGNAIKYNIDGGKINISYKNNKLTIKDSGIGISDSDIINIYDRFYKADQSRNTEGFGIGLSLVKKIIDIYNWEIITESKEGKGSTFTVIF